MRCLLLVVLLVGCSSEPPPSKPSPRLPTQAITSIPLEKRVATSGPRFTRLPASVTKLDFHAPIDPGHPMARLYASGFAAGGLAIGDLDGDGEVEVFVAGGPVSNRLYTRLQQSWSFKDITKEAGVGSALWATGAAMVDIDGDGDLDIYVCHYDAPNALYLNEGELRFTEAAARFGLDINAASLKPAFADYDNDGDLDLYLLTNRYERIGGRPAEPPAKVVDGKPQMLPGYEKYYAVRESEPGKYKVANIGQPDQLLRNDGGRFVEVSEAAGISDHPGHGLSATWWDYDADGDLDLYVGNDYEDADHLYRNDGGRFTDIIESTMPHTTWFSMGADAADVNNDGRMDLLSVDMSATTHFKEKTTMGAMGAKAWFLENTRPPQYMRNALYLNTGTPRFMEVAYLAGIADSDWTWSVKFADYDEDGRVDLFLTNGMTRGFNDSDIAYQPLVGKTEWDVYRDTPPRKERNLAFANAGGLRFEPVGKAWGLDHEGMSFGAAYGDIDNDGDLDLLTVDLDDTLGVYRNNTSGRHRVLIELVGRGGNRQGLGARLEVRSKGGEQLRQMVWGTGFLGGNEPVAHFGLGEAAEFDLVVRWPSGAEQRFTGLAADRRYTILEPESATKKAAAPPAPPRFAPHPLPGVAHADPPFDDYQYQPLLPYRLSALGPGMAWADVDGDGDADLWMGGGRGKPGAIYLNEGGLKASPQPALVADAGPEDMGGLFFDADGDGDDDLYVVSGGNEVAPGARLLRDRLYLNDKGAFTKAAEALPDLRDAGGPVAAADFDRDGDLDLFVGGRHVPTRYPMGPNSRLLRNEGGRFSDVTDAAAPGLRKAGMATSALWTDVDSDGDADLLVAHEFGPVRLWINRGGHLVDQTVAWRLDEHTGLFNSLAALDADGDGDLDYVVGNLGLNTKYHASREHPATIYAGRFYGRPNELHIVEVEYEAGTAYPIRGLSCTSEAMPEVARRFDTYSNFARAGVKQVFGSGLAESKRFTANTLESGLLLNEGTWFRWLPLPPVAQAAPVFGIVPDDFDGDGREDLFLAQNLYAPQRETGRMDGGLGVLLRGLGEGRFEALDAARSGVVLPYDSKSAAAVDLDRDGWPDLAVGVHAEAARALRNRGGTKAPIALRLKGPPGNPRAVGARVTLLAEGGAQESRELRAGGGYLSQSPAVVRFATAKKGSKVRIRWPDGGRTTHTISSDKAVMIRR